MDKKSKTQLKYNIMQKSLQWKKRGQLSLILLLSLLWMTNTHAQSTGALNGVFSVSENTQVNFSQGNLQYIGSTTTPYWKFAEHQWDYFGSTQNGTSQNVDRDLFGFAASGYNHGAVCYQPWSTSTNNSDYYAYGSSSYNLYDQSGKADWGYNAILNGGNQENQWRTLTKDEWVYLFNTRTTLSGIRYAKATVNNVNGVILFPDNWNASIYTLNYYNNAYYDDNTVSLHDWTSILEPTGAVFMPASGYRSGSSTGGVNSNGDYWSSSVYSSSSAYFLNFQSGSLNPQYTAGDGRYYGRAVRLVKNRPMTTGIINAVPNPSVGGTVTGQGLFNIGETCTLIASANSKYAFVNWTKNGEEVSSNPTYSFTVIGNASYMANFARTDINEVTIGSGTSYYSENMPLYNEYSFVQQIYTADEIGIQGPIDEIAFLLRGNSSIATANIDVYLKHTTKTSFDDNYDWETLDLGDLYYSGSYTIGGSEGWKTIKLDTPFNYNGEDNLLVCIDNNSGNISSYHNWYTYPTDDYRAFVSWGWNNNFDPFNPIEGSMTNYINQIKLGFLITQETSLVATPNPVNLGYRPNGAWMRPYQVNIFNTGQGTSINNITTSNSYFQPDSNLGLPFYLGYNDDFELGLNTGTGNGEINASVIIGYGNQNQQAQFDVTATAYTPALGDVWETAEQLTDYPFSATLTPAYIPLFDNYRLPPSNIPDGPDAVYKLVFTEDTYLNASVSNGEDGKVALYPEGFDNVGGPDLDNCYLGPTISHHEWLTYDNGTTYTNVRHNSGTTTWGYKFPAANLAAYAGAKMTQVALYSNSNTGGITTVMIYKGGDSAPETLISTQSFNLPYGLNAYHNVTLDIPFRITGRENVWVIFSAENNGRYPAATTDYYYDSQYNGCWWYDYDTETWMQYQYRGNWKIKAYVTTENNRSIVGGEDEETGTRNLVTIGDGSSTTNQYLPSYSYYNYSLTQQLYTAAEIGQAGNISSISFYNGGTEKTRSFTIYMVNTTKSVFNNSYDWIPVTFDDQVFNGSVTMLENDWTTIQFNTPFEYNGYSNLALIVKDNTGYDSYGLTCRVFTPEAYNYCSIFTYGNANYDPYNPTSYSGSRTREKNQIQLNITPILDNEIVNMTVVPGTYYLVASSTSDSWSIDINAETMPCPKVASNPTPSNNATSVSPTLTQLKWDFGKRTTEYMLKFGTTSECEITLVDWTRDLCNTYTLMGLNNNTQYYWKVLERNDGCLEGVESPTWSFTTHLDGPYIYTSTSYMYVGDTLRISWSTIADTSVYAYNIYQNDSLIGSCSTNYYDVTSLNYNPSVGYTFKVSAVYNGGESNFNNTRNVRVSGYGSVSGHVYEQDGVTPISNANVTFAGRDEFNNSRTLTFVTDSTGFYNGIVYVGNFTCQASYTGYQSKAYPGTIAIVYNNHISDIDFVMDESFVQTGKIIAQYYPDPLDMTSPYVKVFWNQNPNYTDNFESGDFSSLNWVLDQAYPWQISDNNPYEGSYCMKSDNHAPNSLSTMQVTMDIPFDGYFSFFYRISSESWEDYGIFYIDNNQYDYWSGISNNWNERNYSITAGTHTFKWTYSKNNSGDSGDDCFYIDNVRFYVPEDRSEAMNRSFQHYRVYRTEYYNNGPFTEDNTILIADEVTDTLYIDATWADVEMGVYKYGVSKVYEGNLDNNRSRATVPVTFNMFDSYGDGWNGNYLNVVATDGTNESLTVVSGSSQVYILDITEGAHVTLTWTAGSWQDETSFNVVLAGETIFDGYYTNLPFEFDIPGGNSIQSERESKIRWSNAMDKDMYLTNGVDITIGLNSGDSPEGVSVTFTNLNAGEQNAHPTDNNIVLDASGYYAWDNFRKGDYQISIAKEGYETVTEEVSIWDATTLNYVLNEIDYGVNNLYVSRTGWAMWHDHDNNPIPELAGDCFEFNFDNGNVDGLTFINADNYSSNWMLASQKFGTGYGHNGSADCLVSQSYDFDNYNYLYPNEYVVFPLVRFGNNSQFSFYACRHYADSYSEQFAVMVSTSSNSVPADFTVVQEWTMNSNQSNWVHFTVNLGTYAGQTGYIAIRHYNNGNSSRNALDIDDVVLSNGNRGGKGNRHFENYQVMLTNAANQNIFSGNTSDCFIQLPTEDLVDGETYRCKVAGVYNTGTSEWMETDWVYQSCDHFEGVSEMNFEMNSENNVISWAYPEIENNAAITNTAFACSYYASGNNPTSWISYGIDNPQAISVLNSNIQVYGGDYCGADGYVHATYNNNNWYKINPSTGTIVEQGPLGMYFYDCAWDYSTNTMFGIYYNYLYLWDVEANTTTNLGYLNTDMRVLACDFEGQLWGINYYGRLYKIDKTTGSTTEIGYTGQYAYSTIQSAGFDHNTGKLYWMNSDYGYLYEVNTETCQLTRLATNMGCQSSWCIPFTGELSSPSGILGAAIYRDNEFAGFTYGNSFIDTVATGNHEYSVSAVYNGTNREPYWNTYFSMSCPNLVGGEIYTVSTTANPSAGGSITGAGTYINGLSCTLTATANQGYIFTHWTENGEVISNCPEYTFVVRDDHNIVGNFMEYNQHWTVVNNPTYTDMSIIGVLQFNSIEQSADYYEVGAFCNGECRGTQVLTYNPQFHRSILTMTIRGRNNDRLTFKVYDHLHSEEVDLICMNELPFAMNTVVGSFASPYPINFGIMQSTAMQNGWNWYSTFIEQEDIDGLRMLENSLGSEGVMIKSQDDGFVINYQNIWSGSLNNIHNEQMYMINTNGPTLANVVGNKVNVASHPITLHPGWSWIGNPYDTSISLQDALAGFNPSQGDIMKSQQSFASYMDGLGWYGSFNTLEPGLGFMYYSNKNTVSTLNYSGSSNRNERIPNITAENNHWIPNAFEYPYNMTMMAVVMLDDMEIANDQYELAAFANGKCIGSSRLMHNGGLNRCMAYLTIYGEESVDIQFGLYDVASGTEYYSASETLSFEINSIIGNMTEPFVVHFDGTTGLNPSLETSVFLYPNPVSKGDNCKIGMLANGMEKATIEIIDALGAVISVKTVQQQPISITAPNTAGVYTVRITVEGQGSYCRKLVVK